MTKSSWFRVGVVWPSVGRHSCIVTPRLESRSNLRRDITLQLTKVTNVHSFLGWNFDAKLLNTLTSLRGKHPVSKNDYREADPAQNFAHVSLQHSNALRLQMVFEIETIHEPSQLQAICTSRTPKKAKRSFYFHRLNSLLNYNPPTLYKTRLPGLLLGA